MSIYKKLEKYIPAFLLFFVLIVGLCLIYYFFLRTPEQNNTEDLSSLTTKQKLEIQPEFLEVENLSQIDGLRTMEYIRTRFLFHKYNSSKPLPACAQEFERNFPGEKGQVLISLLMTDLDFQKEKSKIDSDENLDEYQKELRIREKRREVFGEVLEPILFPKNDSDTIRLFFYYSKRYLRKHVLDSPRSKKDHLEKARAEIYGPEYSHLKSKEPFEDRLDLELRIFEREMSILDESERRAKVQEIKNSLLWD